MNTRAEAWLSWITDVRHRLAATDPGDIDDSTLVFFKQHWAGHTPCILTLHGWPALNWTMDGLAERIGPAPVQVQVNRLTDPDYEIRSASHRAVMPFTEFTALVQSGPNNDVYMTAQNAADNSSPLGPLYGDLQPLPGCLQSNPRTAFFWIGRGTTTPLHHDMTCNLLCQVVGRKTVRLFSPDQIARLDNHIGVHSRLGWVTDDVVAERGLNPSDVELLPGQALFIPVGWWHCIQTPDVSVTAVFTSFIWPNTWADGFPG